MHSTVLRYRDWIITAHARRIDTDPNVVTEYTGVAFVEKFEPTFDPIKHAKSESFRRKIYYAKGTFQEPLLAKDAAVAIAKLAVDELLS